MAYLNINNISVCFGSNCKLALNEANKGKSRSEIKKNTGVLLAIHNCTFSLPSGKILVLMGLSGSGKSTLLRAINGLERISYGNIKVIHKNKKYFISINKYKDIKYLRKNIFSMVFQQFNLLPWRNVFENVAFGLEILKLKKSNYKDIIMNNLELVGLKDYAYQKIQELSGGMQQRVGLARAFATNNPILLMDEPFSALDPIIKKKLQNQLISIKKKLKKTIIFVTHDLNEAIYLGNFLAIMKDGNIIQYGKPKDIILNPINSDVSNFFQNINPMHFLTAEDIMNPSFDNKKDKIFYKTFSAKTKIYEIIKVIKKTNESIGIIKNNHIVGIISKDDIIFCLLKYLKN